MKSKTSVRTEATSKVHIVVVVVVVVVVVETVGKASHFWRMPDT